MSAFQIIVLGCSGGPIEKNLSGYLVSNSAFSEFISFDAGSLLSGIERAIELGSFSDFPFKTGQRSKEMLTKHIKGYLISHSHLDHIAGLVINSQIDEKKGIYALDETIDHIRDHIFNGTIWPNYGSEGKRALGLYQYHRLQEGDSSLIEGTSFQVTPFKLTHAKECNSTAFLLQSGENYLLYFGDTAADRSSKEKRLEIIWKRIAPLIDRGQLKALMLECSFAHHEAAEAHHGHLDTEMMREELTTLRRYCGSLEGFKVIVTHRKELFLEPGRISLIEKELTEYNNLGIDFIFPTQGQKITI